MFKIIDRCPRKFFAYHPANGHTCIHLSYISYMGKRNPTKTCSCVVLSREFQIYFSKYILKILLYAKHCGKAKYELDAVSVFRELPTYGRMHRKKQIRVTHLIQYVLIIHTRRKLHLSLQDLYYIMHNMCYISACLFTDTPRYWNVSSMRASTLLEIFF